MKRGWPWTDTRGGAAAVVMLLLVTVMVGTDAAVLKGMNQPRQQKVVEAAACSNSISGLMPCYDAVKKQGSPPTRACCSTLSSWGIPCLCDVLSKYASNLPSFVDIPEVLGLPKKCNLAVPKGYQCAGYTFPA